MDVATELVVHQVSTSRHWQQFWELRRSIYRDHPAAVVPLKKMERIQLDTENNPFYQHARRQPFICYRGSRPVGRIVAIKDDLHNEHYNDQVGFFGFFEVEDDQEVAGLLIEAAAGWLEHEGCNRIRGPVNPSMKGE